MWLLQKCITLSPLVKHNRDAHVDYLKHTQENADILREIIEHAIKLRPLDSDLDSACKFVTRIQELLVYVSATCPSLKHVSDKLGSVTPINRTRKFRVTSSTEASGSKPRSNKKKDMISQTSSSNKKKNKVEDHPRIAKSSLNNKNRVSTSVYKTNVKHSVLNVNSELICTTCHECMFDAIHDLCISDYLNDVNARVKSKSVKSRSAKSKRRKCGNLLIARMMGYGDYQLGNVTISRVYYVEGSGYHQKDRKPSQNDKTEHGMEKTVQNQGQSPKMSNDRVNTEEPAVNRALELKKYCWMQS
ncbi:hypothetical protein Tco_0640153 [Tanacetum coccineum]